MSSRRFYPTAPLAAAALIAGYAVATLTGSRPLGGAVLALGGLTCLYLWQARLGWHVAGLLGSVGICALVLSHLLALLLGAWPAVLLASASTATVVWRGADTPAIHARRS